jgi:16S rRNA (cytosine967-C5)-methyltransferase
VNGQRRPDPRAVAWETLNAVENGAFADAELGKRLAGSDLAPRDRALASKLVYGTLAWQGFLDHVVAALVEPSRLQRLDASIRTLLRLALFQLVKLSRVPQFAAVDTAVELSKGFKGGAASGLVNAVLRRFLREGKPIRLPPRESDLAAHLAVALSHPRWLVDRWLAELGPREAESLMRADNEAAPTVLRVNRLRATPASLIESLGRQGVTARRGAYAPDALVLESASEVMALPGWKEGHFTVQGEASQLVAALLGARPEDRVLDVCAAPGGKATQLAERAIDGRVVAIDRHVRGLVQLREAAGRLALDRLSIAAADGRSLPLAENASFDAVLLDAPCSGLGTLRQHPEIRWRRSPESLAALASLQRTLLDSAATSVRRGGVLVYATCTIAREENERVVEDFIARHADFRREDPRPWLPEPARRLVGEDLAFRSLPHRDGLDGFFAVRLRRKWG